MVVRKEKAMIKNLVSGFIGGAFKCPKCGKMIKLNLGHCPYCGTILIGIRTYR